MLEQDNPSAADVLDWAHKTRKALHMSLGEEKSEKFSQSLLTIALNRHSDPSDNELLALDGYLETLRWLRDNYTVDDLVTGFNPRDLERYK